MVKAEFKLEKENFWNKSFWDWSRSINLLEQIRNYIKFIFHLLIAKPIQYEINYLSVERIIGLGGTYFTIYVSGKFLISIYSYIQKLIAKKNSKLIRKQSVFLRNFFG